jgi:uncharacterized membrane protein YfcA
MADIFPSTALLPAVPAWLLGLAMGVVLVAAIVRGFAGFGFSAITLAGLTAFVSPARLVPALFVLEVLSSLGLLLQARREVDPHWLRWLVAGNALAIPAGVAALAWLPERPLRLGVALLLLAAALLLRSGRAWQLPSTPPAQFATGLASGLANGLAAIGGLVVALMLGSATLPPARWRATMIALFLFTDLYALAWAALYALVGGAPQALVEPATLGWVLCMAPPLLLGIAIGRRAFTGVSPTRFRRWVLDLLIVVCGLAVAGSLLASAL